MRLSIVVPTFNMADYVGQTLRSLKGLAVSRPHEIEVIVVDDGSSDDTQARVAECGAGLPLELVVRPRDAHSSRSVARNCGLRRCTGEAVLFIDAGVILEADYIDQLCNEEDLRSQTVVVGEVLGLFAHEHVDDFGYYRTAPPADILAQLRVLRSRKEWRDVREPLFDLVENDLSLLPVGWSLGWTCALAVPRKMALAVDGFDEAFRGWGAEDSDFCYRLKRANATFKALRSAVAIHLPHPTRSREDKEIDCIVNRRLLHRRSFSLETELCTVVLPIRDSMFFRRLEGLMLEYMVPEGDGRLLDAARRNVATAATSLLVGPSSAEIVRALGSSLVAAHNQRQQARLMVEVPKVQVLCSLGCETRFASKSLDAVILTDTMRLYPREVQASQMREAERVGKKAVVIMSAPDAAPAEEWRQSLRAIDGWCWSSPEELQATAASVGLDFAEVEKTTAGWVYSLSTQRGSLPLREVGG